MDANTTHQLTQRLHELADDVGKLNRRTEPGSSLEHLAQRMAGHIQAAIGFLEPTAAQVSAWHAPGDTDAIKEAIRLVDQRDQQLRQRLGL